MMGTYICHLTMEEFRDLNIREYKLSQSTCKGIPMNTALKKAGKVRKNLPLFKEMAYKQLTQKSEHYP